MRILPSKRLPRIAILLAVLLGYSVVLWFFVFPWLDRTFINRPAIG